LKQLLIIAVLIAGIGSPMLAQPPVKVIFDTDMGSDCDDVGALALLHAYADMGKVEIIACVYSSGKVPYGAGVIQAINHYYGRSDIPVGAYQKADIGDSIDKMDAKRLAMDTKTYGNSIVLNSDAPELTGLLRKVLSQEPDQSVVYVTVGHTRGLYDLALSEPDQHSPDNGQQLIETKISKWVALGGLGADGEGWYKDWNFFFNGTAPYTKYLVENFPAPVYYVSAGTDILTGSSLAKLPKGVIVRDAYESWLSWFDGKKLEDQRPSWDLVGVYFAVLGMGDYLTDLGRGRLEFDVEKGCHWVGGQSAHPEQYFITQKPGIADDFSEYLNQMIAKEPEIISNEQ
jgi:hypothetical protein